MINGQTCNLTQWVHLNRFKQKQDDTWFPFLSLPTPCYSCPLPLLPQPRSLTLFSLPILSVIPVHSLYYPSIPCYLHPLPKYPCPLFLLFLLTMSLIPAHSVIPSHSLWYPVIWFFNTMSECLCLFLLLQCIHHGVCLSTDNRVLYCVHKAFIKK